ncbi:MAG: polyprenyl synthetase family protein [Candidatus Hodarchaeales archaeon]|jgi:geranylgeranyl diphosphate synthase type I
MVDISLNDVFREMSKLGKSVEPMMLKFLSKNVVPESEELYSWQTETGGKRLRPALTLLFAQAFGASSDDPEVLAAAAGIELIHTYSLILDDIIDRGDLRRGKPTVRAKFGDEFAILSAIIHREAVYEAAKATGKYVSPTITLFSETIRHLVEGERLDILFEQKTDRKHEYFLSNRYREVTFDDYQRMIEAKTASLISSACKLGALVAGATPEEQVCAGKYGWSVGIAFQMADDYLDMFAVSEDFGKEVYKDLIEQKLGNIVVVQALKLLNEKDATLLKKYLTDPMLSDEDRIDKCVPLLKKSNAKEHVIKESERWLHKTKMNLSTVELKDESKRMILEKIAEFAVRRAF